MKIKVGYDEDEFWTYTELTKNLEASYLRGIIEINEEFYNKFIKIQEKFEEMHEKLREIIDLKEK